MQPNTTTQVMKQTSILDYFQAKNEDGEVAPTRKRQLHQQYPQQHENEEAVPPNKRQCHQPPQVSSLMFTTTINHYVLDNGGVEVRYITTPHVQPTEKVDSTTINRNVDIETITKVAVRENNNLLHRRSYTFNEKLRILKLVESKGLTTVSETHNIPPATLKRWRSQRVTIEQVIARGLGHCQKVEPLRTYKQVFEKAFEMVVAVREMYLGVSMQFLRAFCASENRHFRALSRKKQYKNLATFKRHFNLSLRRRTGVTHLLPKDSNQRIENFYAELRSSFKEARPRRIVVLDETAVLWNPISQTTLEHRGSKNIKIIADDEKKMSTALLWGFMDISFDAKGDPQVEKVCHGKPLVVFKGTPNARIEREIHLLSNSVDIHAAVSHNGWIDEALFLKFLNTILQPSLEQSAWLVLDMYSSHRTKAVLLKMKEIGYSPKFIPPGCTSLVQVHDVCVNKPFKEAIRLYYDTHCCVMKSMVKISRIEVLQMVKTGIQTVNENLLRDGILKLILLPAMQQLQPIQHPHPQDPQLQQQTHAQQSQPQLVPLLEANEADMNKIISQDFDLSEHSDEDIESMVDDDE
jgi:transposase-like protein